MKRVLHPVLLIFTLLGAGLLHAQTHNYSEAFQKALFFYESQTSGPIPLDHRVEWRGPSATRDGSDVGRDLSGGWYDAGDGVVWTGNDAFGASMLAWSLVNHRTVYISTGQYQIAIDRLREINAYLEKITQLDASGNVERLYCGKGSIRNVTPDDPAADNDRTEGCPNELMDTNVGGSPQALRPSYWVDSTTGGADIAGALAAAFASSSIAFRDYGDTTRANELLALAKKVYAWGEANPNLASVTDHNGTTITTSKATRRLTNGAIVTLPDYASRQSDYTPRMLYAAAWLHRADVSAATSGYTTGWVDKAETLYNSSANSSKRSKAWVNFASGSEQNGAYAMLAADTGRSAFVTEANAYARFWANDRSADTGRTTDITVTPEGFLARTQSANWNAQALLDQAPPLLNWADSTYSTDATLKANLISLYTGTYAKCPVKQLDYLLGSNTRKLSYLTGYKPSGTGYDWAKNLLYRATWFKYGGFGTPAADKPNWNTAIAYGALAGGPDHTDFYPQTRTLNDAAGFTLGHQEPIIYTGGLLTVLARNIALGGPSAGSVLGTFPAWETRAADYQTTSFFVRASKDSATKFQCYLNNRASLPPREINTLGFRYYFTPDGVAGSAVTCIATGSGLLSGESVVVTGPTQVGTSTTWYFSIQLKDAMIVPGESKRYQRKVQLEFTQSSGTFDPSNDHSAGSALTSTEATIANLPVYDTSGGASAWKLLGGFEPSAGYIQWRRAHFNNAMESAGSVTLIAERVGGTSGAVSSTVSCTNGTATAADYTAPSGSAAILSWADGEKGEKTIAIPITADSYKEGREYFTATLGSFTGSSSAGITTSARVSIEDDDFNGSLDPGALIQVFGRNTSIADNDTTPSTSDDTDFGEATTSTDTVTRTFTLTNLDSSALTLSGSPLVALSGTNAADFSVTTAPASSVAGSASTTFQITFSPSANGDRTATVTLANNKSTDGTFTFAIKGKGIGAKPVGSLSPASVTKELKPGGSTAGSTTQAITVTNTGRADLPWTASLPTNYTAKTSTAANGPAYNWIDITTAGANLGTTLFDLSTSDQDDEISATTSIGFSFPFYGSNKTQLKVCTNGWVTFDTSSNSFSYSNYAIPSSALPSPGIAVWWDDLKLFKANAGANVYYKRVDADTFVVTWKDIGYYTNSSAKMSFQLILKRNGQIICQYKDVLSSPDSTGYTIGAQGANAAAQAVQYAYNTKTAENGIAIEFRPPPQGSYDVTGATGNWATLGTTSGTANAQSSSSFNLSLNTTGLISGQSYPTEITVATPDDTVHPSYTVPVTLTAKQVFNFASSGTSNRVWETNANWSTTTTAFPGPSDDLTLTTAGGSLRIDGPRTINALTLNASAGLTLTGTGFGGTGTGATLTTNGLVTVLQGSLLAGGSTARLQLNDGLTVSGGTFGFASGANGSITVADDAPITLSGGILDTLVNTSSTIYRQTLGTGDLKLSGTAPEIKVTEDTFTLARRLTGTGGFKKTGTGTLLLSGANADHSGTTELTAGTLKLGAANALGGDSTLKLSGGTLATNGQTVSVGTLNLAATSTIDFTGGGTVVFADSSAVTWAGTTLALTNFDSATCSIRFGNSATGITSAQIAKITLNGTAFPLTSLNANGYLDNAAPSWVSGWPKADTATSTGFTARAQLNEQGTAYFVVVADAATAPTAAQVKAGQNAIGSSALASGSIALTANTEGTAAVTGLASSTAYDIYFIAQDVVPNLQSTPIKIDLTTVASERTWDGGGSDSSWSTAANWDNDQPAPVAPNNATFPAGTGKYAPSLSAAASIGNLTFTGANSYTLGGTGPLTLAGGISKSGSTVNQTINTPIILSGQTAVFNNSATTGGNLILGGNVTGTGHIRVLSTDEFRLVRFGGANAWTGNLILGNFTDFGAARFDGTGLPTGTIFFEPKASWGNALTFGNGSTQTFAVANPITFSAGSSDNVGNIGITISTSANATISGNITSADTAKTPSLIQFSLGTSSTLTLSGTNNFTGIPTFRLNDNASGATTKTFRFGANALNGVGTFIIQTVSGDASNRGVLRIRATTAGQTVTQNFQFGGQSLTTGLRTASVGGDHASGTVTFSGNMDLAQANWANAGNRADFAADTAGATILISGLINDGTNTQPVTISGNGTVRLTRAAGNTYDGTTTVNGNATLLVENTSNSATGTGAVTVASGATLGGTGSLSGALTIASGGKFAFTLSTAPASHDRLDVGAVTLSGASSVVITASGSAPTTGAYTLLRSTSTLTGTVPTLTLPTGYTGSLAFSTTDLVLTLTQVPFANWAAQSGLTGNNALPTADPDGDGLANLLEYALGTEPGNATSGSATEAAIEGTGKLTLTFTPQRVSGLTYTVQASNDLVTWSDTVLSGLTVGSPYTHTDFIASPTRRFLRLRVTEN